MRLLRERIAADAPAPRVAELAELCALTPRQLSRTFKAETGRTIGSLVDETTVERAQGLLATTDLPIGAIAARLGFASIDTFAQSFRRITGLLPSQFRRS
jgi:AraC family transcriptional regulator